MAVDLSELTRDKWKAFKEKNGLSKSKFLNKADVGPTIETFRAAVVTWQKQPGEKSLMALFKQSESLNKAFAKFIGIKEGMKELSPEAKKKIEKWAADANTLSVQLAQYQKQYEKDLKKMDGKRMLGDLKAKFNF